MFQEPRVVRGGACSALNPKVFDKRVIRKGCVDMRPLGPTDQNKLIFLLDNVFSMEECEALIRVSEQAGYQPALTTVPGGLGFRSMGIRDGNRVIIDDKEFAKVLQERILHFLPSKFEGYEFVGVHERLRFLRYDPKDQFSCHKDSAFITPDGSARTFITLQMYLNEGFSGGHTTFFECADPDSEKATGPGQLSVMPKVGRVLVFQHDLLHEGSLVTTGRKYTVRTDVLFKRKKKSGFARWFKS